MRLVVVCLLLSLSPTLARATDVRLLTDRVRLEEPWLHALSSAPLRLSAPCLACHLGSFASAPAGLVLRLPPSGVRAVPRAKGTRLRAPTARRRVIAIGDSWQLGHGRELSIRLTPTQEECAPLLRLKF